MSPLSRRDTTIVYTTMIWDLPSMHSVRNEPNEPDGGAQPDQPHFQLQVMSFFLTNSSCWVTAAHTVPQRTARARRAHVDEGLPGLLAFVRCRPIASLAHKASITNSQGNARDSCVR